MERRRQEYHRKEEQDVAVFLEISQRLSSESLLFLLQNHARTVLYNSIPPAQLDAVLLQQQQKRKETTAAAKKIPKRIKQFRFAVVTHDQVRTVVHEIPRVNDDPDDDSVADVLVVDAARIPSDQSGGRPTGAFLPPTRTGLFAAPRRVGPCRIFSGCGPTKFAGSVSIELRASHAGPGNAHGAPLERAAQTDRAGRADGTAKTVEP